MASYYLEVPAFGFKSCGMAVLQGAHRLELNATGSYAAGGTTPSLADLTFTMGIIAHYSHVPVRVMVRPRGPPPAPAPDFVYSDEEFHAMRNAIAEFKQSGELRSDKGDGFVFGILKPAGPASEGGRLAVDVERNAELVRLAQPFQCVFHRAFDDILGSSGSTGEAIDQALEDIRQCGFHGILTSGGPGNAPGNVGTVSEIIARAKGTLEIIVGGGVRSKNAKALAQNITARRDEESGIWFHSSCLTAKDGSEMVDRDEVKSLIEELRST